MTDRLPSSLPPAPGSPAGTMARIGYLLRIGPRMPAVWFIRAYRATVSRTYGPVCKYYPSCSQYALDAFEHDGLLRGTVRTAWRLLRCNPWSNGGVDYVPGSVLERRSKMLRGAAEASEAAEVTEKRPHRNGRM